MRSGITRKIAVATLAAALAVIGLSTPAHANDTTGTITGQFTDSQGQPIADAQVVVETPDGNWITYTYTDDQGNYTETEVAPGTYIILFSWGELSQFGHGTPNYYDATTVSVEAGSEITFNEQALPTGTIAGTLTNADGTPAAGISISAYADDTGFSGFTSTDDSGHWSMTVFPSQQYRVMYSLSNGLTEFAPSQTNQENAGHYALAAGQTVTVDDSVLLTGTISGTFTDANGTPMPDAWVAVNFTNSDSGPSTMTDAGGNYSIEAFAGAYNVSFADADTFKVQYAYGQLSQTDAAVINVTAGETTVVNDSAVATGTITVTATDASTGAAVMSFCAYADQERACAKGTGVAVIKNVRAGNESVSVSVNNGRYLFAPDSTVTVTAGANTDFNQVLQPAAIIKTTVVDSATGAPIAGACAYAFKAGNFMFPSAGHGCSDSTGKLKIDYLPGGSYNLFVNPPRESSYGNQWLTIDGGSGSEADAKKVNAAAGSVTKAPSVTLDQGGTISGIVTDANGHPIVNASVGPNMFAPGIGDGGDLVDTDDTGHYTLTNMGPYAWPISAAADGFAAIWTGGGANRDRAATIQVTSGAAVTNDVALTAGAQFKGTALRADGTPTTSGGQIWLYNAATGDIMGFVEAKPDGSFSLPMTPGQNVYIEYWFQDADGTVYEGWYGGPTRANATAVHIPKSGVTVSVTLVPGDNIH